MNKKRFSIIALAIISTLAMATPMKCAMSPDKGKVVGACGCGGPMPTIMTLNLTKDQSTKMQEIMKQWHADKNKAMQGKGKPMLSAFHDGKFDREEFIAKHNEMALKMANKKADVIEKMYSLLTPEQKRALEAKSK